MQEPLQQAPLPPQTASAYPFQTMLGDTIILLTDEQFVEGYESGQLFFRVKYRSRTLVEQEIYHELMQTLWATHLTDRWKTGYVLGWAQAAHEPYLERLPEQQAGVTPAMVACGGPPLSSSPRRATTLLTLSERTS